MKTQRKKEGKKEREKKKERKTTVVRIVMNSEVIRFHYIS
jgi:hypothetical protein